MAEPVGLLRVVIRDPEDEERDRTLYVKIDPAKPILFYQKKGAFDYYEELCYIIGRHNYIRDGVEHMYIYGESIIIDPVIAFDNIIL